MTQRGERLEYALDHGAPWSIFESRLRTKAPKDADSKKMIKVAGLDWKVATGPLYGPNGKEIPNKRAIYRVKDGTVLGISSPTYQPWQNVDAFNFADSLVKDRVMHYVAAGDALGGRKIWILGRLDKDMKINGEKHEQYLLIAAGHDVQTAITGSPTGLRVFCFNMVPAVMAGGQGIRISHHPKLEERLEVARKFLEVTVTSMGRMKTWLETAAGIDVPDDAFDRLEEKMFGSMDEETPTKRANAIELFREIYDEEAERNGDTAYTLFNTVTGYADHGKRQKGDAEQRAERRFLSITEGSAARWKERGIHEIEQLFPKLARETQYVSTRRRKTRDEAETTKLLT